MINAYGQYRKGEKALQLFNQMKEKKIYINHITLG
jgi:pentatricopeptide repeat protein